MTNTLYSTCDTLSVFSYSFSLSLFFWGEGEMMIGWKQNTKLQILKQYEMAPRISPIIITIIVKPKYIQKNKEEEEEEKQMIKFLLCEVWEMAFALPCNLHIFRCTIVLIMYISFYLPFLTNFIHTNCALVQV